MFAKIQALSVTVALCVCVCGGGVLKVPCYGSSSCCLLCVKPKAVIVELFGIRCWVRFWFFQLVLCLHQDIEL